MSDDVSWDILAFLNKDQALVILAQYIGTVWWHFKYTEAGTKYSTLYRDHFHM